MDFLKDSKNTPIVIGLLLIGIGGAIFSFVHFVVGSERPVPPALSSANLPAGARPHQPAASQ